MLLIEIFAIKLCEVSGERKVFVYTFKELKIYRIVYFFIDKFPLLKFG